MQGLRVPPTEGGREPLPWTRDLSADPRTETAADPAADVGAVVEDRAVGDSQGAGIIEDAAAIPCADIVVDFGVCDGEHADAVLVMPIDDAAAVLPGGAERRGWARGGRCIFHVCWG